MKSERSTKEIYQRIYREIKQKLAAKEHRSPKEQELYEIVVQHGSSRYNEF